MLAGVLAAAFISGCGSGGDAEPAPAARSIVATTTPIGSSAWGVDVDPRRGVVWVTDPSRGTLVRLAASGRVTAEFPVGGDDPRVAGIHVAGDRVWVANLAGTVNAVDPSTGAVVAGAAIAPGESAALLARDDGTWVPLHGTGGGLVRLDPASLQEADRVALPESAFAITEGPDDVLWVAGLDRRAFAVDSRTASLVRSIDVGPAPRGITAGAGSIWVTSRDGGEVVRLDPDTGDVEARIDVQGAPWPIAFGGGRVWTATADGRAVQIDPATNAVVAVAAVGAEPRGIAVGLGAAWVTSQAGTVSRVPLGR